jgi:hypothetical protein
VQVDCDSRMEFSQWRYIIHDFQYPCFRLRLVRSLSHSVYEYYYNKW